MSSNTEQWLWVPRRAFLDFTLKFEEIVFDLVPSGLLLVLSPVILFQYVKNPLYTRPSPLLWVKIVIVIAIIGIEVAALVLWTIPSVLRTETTLAAASLDLLAVLTIGAVVYVEHRHAIQASALLGLYLFVGVVADIIKSRSFFRHTGLAHLGALAATSAILRASLLGLQEVPKRELLREFGREATSGYWSRSFLTYLYPMMIAGFRGVLVLSDLNTLGPEFASDVVYPRFTHYWEKAHRASQNALFLTCIQAWKSLFAVILLPRLAQSGFSLAQPFILQRAIAVIGDDMVGHVERGFLLGATILCFGGSIVSKTTTAHLNSQLITRIRGALTGQMFDKSLRISQSESKNSATLTLMSADIEGIAAGMPKMFELVMTSVDLALGIYVLSLFVGKSCFVVLGPLVVSAIATYFIGKRMAVAFTAWNAEIESRVSKTSKVLSQVKALKMFGLAPTINRYLQNLRQSEMAKSNSFRALQSISVISVLCAEYLTPVVVIAAALFWNTFRGNRKMTAATVFPALSVVVLIKDPLSLLLGGYPTMKAMFGCFRRIQAFLNLPERKDPRIIDNPSFSTSTTQNIAEAENVIKPLVQFSNVGIAPLNSGGSILKELDFAIMPGSITGVAGPNGSGKSMLLNSILGETEVPAGEIRVQQPDIALCEQVVWLRNASIKENIIWPLPYDEPLFQKVLWCCLLDEDIQLLPEGSDYQVGSGGSRLSGGQRQRVGLARSLFARKRLLLLDDVFSSLDRRTAISILFRLCGEDGMLRQLNSAAVIATYLPECLDLADQLLVLDGNGHATVKASSRDKALRMDAIQSLASEILQTTKDMESKEQEVLGPPRDHQLAEPKAVLKENTIRRDGDWSLYWLFIDPMGRTKVAIWAFVMFLASVAEMAPDVYMRLWIERDAENGLYFIGYASIAVLACFLFVVDIAILFIKMMPRTSLGLHQQLVDCVLQATIGFLGTTENGIIVNRFSQDMTLMARTLVVTFLRTTSVFFTATIQSGIIVSGASYMAITLPLIAVAIYFIQRFYLRTSRQIRAIDLEQKSPLYTHFEETAAGLIHIRAFGWQQQNFAVALKFLDDSQKGFYYMYCIQQWLGLVLGLLSTCIAGVLMTMALFSGKSSETAIGLSFLNLILFAKTLEQLINTWTGLETSVGALDRLREFIKTTPQERGRNDVQVPVDWPSSGSVELAGVTARYDLNAGSPPALKNVTLSINPGQKVGIIGRTGSGKSSLFLTLLGFLQYEGVIKFDNVDISKLPLDTLRSRVVTVSQDQIQLEASVRINLLPFALNDPVGQMSDDEKQAAALKDNFLTDILSNLSIWTPLNGKGGLDVSLKDVGYSHGQMQLFCLARGIIRQQDTGSKIVLIDEATSSVEQLAEGFAKQVMQKYFANCTVLVIGHRDSSVNDTEVMLEFAKGEVTRREESGQLRGNSDGPN